MFSFRHRHRLLTFTRFLLQDSESSDVAGVDGTRLDSKFILHEANASISGRKSGHESHTDFSDEESELEEEIDEDSSDDLSTRTGSAPDEEEEFEEHAPRFATHFLHFEFEYWVLVFTLYIYIYHML